MTYVVKAPKAEIYVIDVSFQALKDKKGLGSGRFIICEAGASASTPASPRNIGGADTEQ
jgi:hypothetical protein